MKEKKRYNYLTTSNIFYLKYKEFLEEEKRQKIIENREKSVDELLNM